MPTIFIFPSKQYKPCLDKSGTPHADYFISEDSQVISTKAARARTMSQTFPNAKYSKTPYVTFFHEGSTKRYNERVDVLQARSWVSLEAGNAKVKAVGGGYHHKGAEHHYHRNPRLETSHWLSDADVRLIRKLRAECWTVKALSQRFNRAENNLYHLLSGKTYKHVK